MCGGKAVSFILPAVGNGSVSIAIHISLSLFGRQKMYTYVLLLSGPLRIIARLWQKGTKRGGEPFPKTVAPHLGFPCSSPTIFIDRLIRM